MMNFTELGLNEALIKSITAMGYTTPTPIQEKAIPVLLSGTKDFIGLAQTGTGKTAAFALPLLHLVDPQVRNPQALIVCPTRELCMQIVKETELFKKHIPGIQVAAVYGGTPISTQISQLKRGVQITVATPGRLIDLIERGAIQLSEIRYVVLDEADEMLNMGFEEDIEFILKNTVNRDSMWLFSATMPTEIRKVVKKYMKEPAEVQIGTVNTSNKNIDHQYYTTAAAQKYDTLKRLIDFNPGMYGLIFVRTKIDADKIAARLSDEGYDIDALHGDLNQAQRTRVMNSFRDKSIQLLIATDVAARGIDVQGISHVINFDLPDDMEVYTHRSGRTGRAGNTGICMSIIHSREVGKIRQIERMVQARFHKLEIPQGRDVTRKQFYHFIDKLLQADISHGEYEMVVPIIEEKLADVSREELIKRVAALEFNQFIKYYRDSEDLNVKYQEAGSKAQRGKSGSDSFKRDTRGREFGGGGGATKKLFINLGSKDGFYKASFLQFILDGSGLTKEVLGRIDMKDINSWIEIDSNAASQMIKALNGKKFNGRKLRMNEA
jgi:ATP-dependent RNA helicase DeaD